MLQLGGQCLVHQGNKKPSLLMDFCSFTLRLVTFVFQDWRGNIASTC